MKKVISITLSLLLALSVLTSLYAMPINASEGDYEENGICYKLNGDNTAAAVGCEDDLSYIAIPEELDNGYKVTEISDGAFRGKVDFTSAYIDAKLSKTSKTIKKGKSFTLKITGKVGTPTFKSGNKKVATVTKSGKITAKKKGKAIITVKTNGITLKCKITVK